MQSSNVVRVNFTLPNEIYLAFKCLVPERRRSKVVTSLIAEELKKRERDLSKAAKAVEKDKSLLRGMKEWDKTLTDGLEDIEWK